MSEPRQISAPGKLFLAGEYVVLAGGTAVVAAVDRRVTGRLDAGATASSPVVAEAIRATRAHLTAAGAAPPAGAPVLDSGALARGEDKLGLGSSAAAAAVTVAVLLDAAGFDVAAERALVFRLADQAHRAAQDGRGSGADVAAAVYGGCIAYTRQHGAPAVRALAGPPPAAVVVFRAGKPSRTSDAIRAVVELAARDRRGYEQRMAELGASADAFLRGYDDGDAGALIAAAVAAGTALGALGRDADLPIVTPALDAAAALARELGGAAKPSGAGGGDVGVAFFHGDDAAQTFQRRAPERGLEIVPIALAARGVGRDG